jgi:hypothetical protein
VVKVGGRGEVVVGGDGGGMHVGENVGDVEIHFEGVDVGAGFEGDWRRRGWKGGEDLGCRDNMWRRDGYVLCFIKSRILTLSFFVSSELNISRSKLISRCGRRGVAAVAK